MTKEWDLLFSTFSEIHPGAQMYPGALSISVFVWVLGLPSEAQSLQFLPITCLCPFCFSSGALSIFILKPSLPSSFLEVRNCWLLSYPGPVPEPALLLKGGLTKSHRCLNLRIFVQKKKNLSPCLRPVELCLVVWKCSRENHLSTLESQLT